ncbi:MAG TPA: hypothetical protein VFJ18_04670, partial [Pararhizobium sp.]|nr:hypothetical protein [Pararhizobium sp.]
FERLDDNDDGFINRDEFDDSMNQDIGGSDEICEQYPELCPPEAGVGGSEEICATYPEFCDPDANQN